MMSVEIHVKKKKKCEPQIESGNYLQSSEGKNNVAGYNYSKISWMIIKQYSSFFYWKPAAWN